VLLTAPGGLADQFPKDMARLARLFYNLVASRVREQAAAEKKAP